MKRRSFFKAIGAAAVAAFVPAAVAKPDQFTEVLSQPIEIDSGFLSEAALEDMVIEINQFRSATGDVIAIKPTRVWCYPEYRNAAFEVMAAT